MLHIEMGGWVELMLEIKLGMARMGKQGWTNATNKLMLEIKLRTGTRVELMLQIELGGWVELMLEIKMGMGEGVELKPYLSVLDLFQAWALPSP